MLNGHSRNLHFDCPETLEEWIAERRRLAAHALSRAQVTDDADLAADLNGAAASLFFEAAIGAAEAPILCLRCERTIAYATRTEACVPCFAPHLLPARLNELAGAGSLSTEYAQED